MISEAVLGFVTNRAENENAEQEQYVLCALLIFGRDTWHKNDTKEAQQLSVCVRVKFWPVLSEEES